MAYKDLHEKPFDNSTLAKLEIFEDYAEAWIPTFVMSGHKTICIFDLFAGTGYDKNSISGSPIRILQKVKKFIERIKEKETKINIYFNEFKSAKFELLKLACNKYLEDNPDVKNVIKIEYSKEDFDVCFNRLIPEIAKHPSLVFLDQNGVKFLADKYLLALEKTTKTDFLYFVSSSYIKRFGDSEEFKQHINFDVIKVAEGGANFIHRNIIAQLLTKLPKGSELKLYPFSLKKGTNIYGIIFGAKNPLAVDKFLDIAWKHNSINGDANFDLDEDKKKGQLNMFEAKRLTKIESFEQALEEKIKEKGTISNGDIYLFTLGKGHPRQHAANHLRQLKKDEIVYFDGSSPKITYDGLTKKEDSVVIKWLKK